MPGLLSDVLPFVYSQGNRAKRYIGGLLSDPVAELQQTAGKAVDDLNAVGRLTNQAIDPRNPAKIVNRQAFNQLADQYMNSMLNFAPVGATVWHGSPHKFDKFDSSKIGTGEGAQAYGHGLYLAESPDVAGSYQSTLAHKNNASLVKNGPNNYDVIAPDGTKVVEGAWLGKASKAKEAYDAAQTGSLYKVDLPDSAIAKMLDWDKPLSQQAPEVRDILSNVARELPEPIKNIGKRNRAGIVSSVDSLNGGDAYFNLGGYNHAGKTSELLRQAGIPGIRYLDGGSRGVGAGTSNFVVFPGNENLLTILERNGKPLGLLGD